jgi:hypothetical protein
MATTRSKSPPHHAKEDRVRDELAHRGGTSWPIDNLDPLDAQATICWITFRHAAGDPHASNAQATIFDASGAQPERDRLPGTERGQRASRAVGLWAR